MTSDRKISDQSLSKESLSAPGSINPRDVNTVISDDLKVGTQPESQFGTVPQYKTLGRYRILGELGRGGMGTVFLAEDTVLTRNVALKIPQFDQRNQEQMQARFIREARIAAQLTHPNICQVYDVGVIDGQLVMAMEYIEGCTLDSLTRRAKLVTERQAAGLVRKIAMAVEVAHRKGLIHRDLKPGNIMLPKADPVRKTIEPKVMDFGLAKSLESTGKQVTRSGMIVGTPCYMSKEQWAGKDGILGPMSDVYSLGIILYELLTGALPYDSEDGEPVTAWFVKLVTKPQILPSERRPVIDARLEAIVMRSIAKEPEDRYATMAQFADALDGWIKGKVTPAGTMVRSLMDLQYDNELFAFLEDQPKRALTSKGKPPETMRDWVKWTYVCGAAVLLFGIGVLLFGKAVRSSSKENDKTSAVMPKENRRDIPAVTPTVNNQKEVSDRKTGGIDSLAHPPASEAPNPAISPFDAVQAKRYQIEWAEYLGVEVEYTNSIGMKFRLIPPGEFLMGSSAQDVITLLKAIDPNDTHSIKCISSESPQHLVRLTRPFYLGVHEVTQKQYRDLSATNPSHFSGIGSGRAMLHNVDTDNFPVEMVSCNDCDEFFRLLNEREKPLAGFDESVAMYRLPTEAEWEFACRAGSGANYGYTVEFGTADYARNLENSMHRSGTIGEKMPNGFGQYDMLGNVWEWCQDTWTFEDYRGLDSKVSVNPICQIFGNSMRITKGGSWRDTLTFCRAADRHASGNDFRFFAIGFRGWLSVDAVKAGIANRKLTAGAVKPNFEPKKRGRLQSEYPPAKLRLLKTHRFGGNSPFKVLSKAYEEEGVLGIRSSSGWSGWNFQNMSANQLVRAKIRVRNKMSGWAGVCLTQDGDQHGAAIWLTGDQRVILSPSMFAKEQPKTLQRSFTLPEIVRPIDEWNELAFVLQTSSLSIFVNDQHVNTLDLTEHSINPATLSFASQASEADTVVEMDEYSIYDIQ